MDKVNNIVDYGLDEILNGVIIDASTDYVKDKKYKVGKGVDNCKLQELPYLKGLVCNPPCYFTHKEMEAVSDYIHNLNGR